MAILALGMFAGTAVAEDTEPITVAVFQFEAKERALEDPAALVTELVNLELSIRSEIDMVSREELEKILTEQQMNMAGLTEANAPAIGRLVGAQVIVVGRLFEINKRLYMTARAISTETSRTFAAKTKGNSSQFDTMAEDLGRQLTRLIEENRKDLVVSTQLKKNQLAHLRKSISGKDLPRVFVYVREDTPNIITIDPAAQTEIQHILIKCGFDVVKDMDGSLKSWAEQYMADGGKAAPPEVQDVDLVIIGEGMSEFGAKNGDLFSCRARLELEVLDPTTGKVIGSDRETTSGVDLAEQIASKTALQNAAAKLAFKMLPESVKSWRELKKADK